MDNRIHFPARGDSRLLPKALILLCNCDHDHKLSIPPQKENQSSNPWVFRLNDVWLLAWKITNKTLMVCVQYSNLVLIHLNSKVATSFVSWLRSPTKTMNCAWTPRYLYVNGTLALYRTGWPLKLAHHGCSPMDISKSEVCGELLVEIFAVASFGFHGDQWLDTAIVI